MIGMVGETESTKFLLAAGLDSIYIYIYIYIIKLKVQENLHNKMNKDTIGNYSWGTK